MKLLRALALLGLVALPVSAAAQEPVVQTPEQALQLRHSRFAVTPFVGVRVPFSTGDEYVFFADETVATTVVRREHGGSVAAGAEGEYRVTGPWSVVGTVSYSPGGNDVVRILDSNAQETTLSADAPDLLFARLGVSLRLPDPDPDARRFHPGGFIVVAPALVHLRPEIGESSTHPALNLGIQATAPVGRSRRLAFQLGLDDYVTFWDTDALAREDEAALGGYFGEPVVVDYDYSMTNLLMVRLGASFRF